MNAGRELLGIAILLGVIARRFAGPARLLLDALAALAWCQAVAAFARIGVVLTMANMETV